MFVSVSITVHGRCCVNVTCPGGGVCFFSDLVRVWVGKSCSRYLHDPYFLSKPVLANAFKGGHILELNYQLPFGYFLVYTF